LGEENWQQKEQKQDDDECRREVNKKGKGKEEE
jgi:hypothetical protein